VSNAADALDKLRFAAVTDPSLIPSGAALGVRLIPDREANTLTISDNGIGMSREELVDHLGTIARSGTRELAKKLAEAKETGDLSLIGQFGVGFYSSYLVADRVEVVPGEGGLAAEATPHSAPAAAAGQDDQEVRAHGCEGGLHPGLGPLADRHHRDDRGHPDDHAEGGEERAHLVPEQRPDRHADGLQRRHGATSSGAVATGAPGTWAVSRATFPSRIQMIRDP
ncbi:MAG: ATP-binding protein, partial [Myxococcales bacterium]|nr:ATP-binding protein [Myxococcales bacterium]